MSQRRNGLLALVLLLVTLLASPAALAQAAPDADAEGKRHFEAGKRLYREHAVAEALAEFELSYKLGGKATALKNAAQCHRDLKQFAQAYEAFETLLSVHARQLSAAEQTDMTRALGELGVLTGTLSFKSSDAGASVELDGAPLGTLPIARPKRVGLGVHKVHVTKPGFEPFDKDLSVASEQALEVVVALAPEVTTGHVSVHEQNGRAGRLFVDGTDVGALPFAGELAPGDHTIEARGEGFEADKRTATVVKKQQLDLVIELRATTGRVRITALPASARIMVDDVARGTGAWDGALPPGSHRVEVSLEGYPTATRQIDVVRGEAVVLEVPLVGGVTSAPMVPAYSGIYGRFSLLGGYGVVAPHYELPSGAPSDAKVTGNTAAGAGVALRIGYSFGWWSLEGIATFSFVHEETRGTWGADVVGPGGASNDGVLLQTNGFETVVGVGPRVTSKHDVIRFTFGAGPGVLVRNVVDFKRAGSNDNGGGGCMGMSCPPVTQGFKASGGYVSPVILLEAGLLLGSTPGAKFFLGAQAWIDFGQSLVVGPDIPSAPSCASCGNAPFPSGYFDSPGRGWKATYGTEVFLGPELGVQFGR